MNEAVLAPALPPQAAPSRGAGLLTAIFRAYEWTARREVLTCAIVFFLTVGIRIALLPWFPPPLPDVHDEFGYLLAADTYVSGRVANPPHPMWRHLETFHELMQPVYASKYPPLQGLVLAFGQKFFGIPWAGVLLSMGFLCAAICWMLQGWLTPNLAFLGGLLFVLRVGVLSYWMNSYWGGAVPGIGGALVLGSLPRLWRRRQSGYLIAFAAGLAILMHSRPWEGAILGMAALGVLVWTWREFTPYFRKSCFRSAVPALAILLASFGAQAYLDYRVTGSPLTMPHAVYDRQYEVAPIFAFLPLRPEPVYRHAVMHDMFTGWNGDLWRKARKDPLDAALGKLSITYDFFFGLWPLLIPPLIWPYPLKTREEGVAVVLLVVFILTANLPLIGFEPHYAAPIAGLLYVRFLQTLSRLLKWRPAGKPLGFAVAVFFVTLFAYPFATDLMILFRFGVTTLPFASARNSIAQKLERMPGRQLVLVRYAPDHNQHEEWVWNRADIDGSQTVWARAMDRDQDAELTRYFSDRTVWLLEADKMPPQLTRYPARP